MVAVAGKERRTVNLIVAIEILSHTAELDFEQLSTKSSTALRHRSPYKNQEQIRKHNFTLSRLSRLRRHTI